MVSKVLLVETVGVRGIQNLLLKPINREERLWVRDFLDKSRNMSYNNYLQ
jgi:hypothetical protein